MHARHMHCIACSFLPFAQRNMPGGCCSCSQQKIHGNADEDHVGASCMVNLLQLQLNVLQDDVMLTAADAAGLGTVTAAAG